MAIDRKPRGPKHLKRISEGSGNESVNSIVVLIAVLLVVVIVIFMMISLASNSVEIEELDYSADRDDFYVLNQDQAYRPFKETMANYRPYRVSKPPRKLGDRNEEKGNSNIPDNMPGVKIKEIEALTAAWPVDFDGVDDPEIDLKTLALAKAKRFGGVVDFPALDEIEKIKKEPVVKILPVDVDRYHLPRVEVNLKREALSGNFIPLPGGDSKSGPFFRPIQMETPWLAFDKLIKDVAELPAEKIGEANNGEAFIEGDHPEHIINLRGKVFTLRGRLFMLRKQPLRTGEFSFAGKQHQHAYFGIVSYIKKSPISEKWEHYNAAFTALDVPEELKKYAIEAGDTPNNHDLLAREQVNVELDGVYFRRFCYHETFAELAVSAQRAAPGVDLENYKDVATYASEDYMPWLVSQSIAPADIEPLGLEVMKEAVDQVHSDQKVHNNDLRRFDEAGYYLCLQALNAPDSPLSDEHSEELVLRMLGEASRESSYRGARAKVAGILRDPYFALVLPPNISGKRHLYRTFITDTLDPSEAENDLALWYVDTLEPPVKFRGQPQVMVDGYYYRSQLFATNDGGKIVTARIPLILTKSLEYFDPRAFPTLHADVDAEGDSGNAMWVALATVLGLGLVLLVVIRFDRKRRASFEDDAMEHIRGRLQRARARVREEKRGKSEGPEKKTSAEDDSAKDEA